MLLASAQSAALLAPKINLLTANIAALNTAINNTAILSGGSLAIFDPVTDSNQTLTVQLQTAAESASIFTLMIAVLQARLDALNAQLATL